MENIIYFLKQKEHNRVKIGSTTNIQKRVEKLEKDWGKFDDESELHYFNIDKLMLNQLSLDNIEKTIQRIMKLKNQYLDFSSEYGKKDGKTEFFKLNQVDLDETINIFQDSITKKGYIKDIQPKTNSHELVVLQKYYDIKKQNKLELKACKGSKSNIITSNTDKVKDGKGSLRDFINKNQKSINKMKTLIHNTFIEYSVFNDLNKEKIVITIIAKSEKIEKSIEKFIPHSTLFEEFGTQVREFSKFDCVPPIYGYDFIMDGYTVSFNDENKTQTAKFVLNYSEFCGAKLFYVKYIARQILNVLNEKNISKKINFLSKNKINDKLKQKQLYKKCFDSKNIFRIFHKKNEIEEVMSIDFNNICEVYGYSERFEILLLNGKKIEFLYEWYIEESVKNWELQGYQSVNDAKRQFIGKRIIDDNITDFFFKICKIKYIKIDFR